VDEDELLRSVAMQNASSILVARQRAEQALRDANEALAQRTGELAQSLTMMRATLEATWDGILVTDAEGRVTDFNQRFVRMWQLPDEVVARLDHRAILAHTRVGFADGDAFVERIEEIYTETPAESLDLLELADGRVFERYSRVQSIGDRHVGRVWSFRDITERRQTEQALRDESRLLELLNRTGTALSSQLDVTALVHALSDAATDLSGARCGAFFESVDDAHSDALVLHLLSGGRREAFRPGDQPHTTTLLRVFTGRGAIRIDDLADDPSGAAALAARSSVRSYLAVPVVSRSGDVMGALCFGHPDAGVFTARTEQLITGVAAQAAVAIDNARLFAAAQAAAEERTHLLESERFARTQAERASAMKDEFLATLSHELRTPLSAILGWAHLLRMRRVGEEEMDRGLEVIERNARVQTELIEDLLDMSRIISGKMRLDIQVIDPISVIEAALETVKPAADAKGIRITRLLDPAAGPINGDPNRLQQVVWNLLSNAIKFTPRQGRVHVSLERVDAHVEIAVADSGIGIAPEFLPHVFERFRQADPSRTRTAKGLGLGLAIVKHLVELHGGSARVSSSGEGHGATFAIHLPRTAALREAGPGHDAPVAAPVPAAPEFNRSDLSGITVLVVDDQEDARELIRRVLEECDATVRTAENADEALAAVERERPHVLVTDIGMPGVDGYELLRRVRKIGPQRGGALPAIALTAFARSEDRTRALRAGFLVHVAKPVEPSELVATVASVVGRTGDPSPS
jgi:PAS domain S-box-containing protein